MNKRDWLIIVLCGAAGVGIYILTCLALKLLGVA